MLHVEGDHREESSVAEKMHGLAETVLALGPKDLDARLVPSFTSCVVLEK